MLLTVVSYHVCFRAWGTNSNPLQEEQLLLIMEPSLQPPASDFERIKLIWILLTFLNYAFFWFRICVRVCVYVCVCVGELGLEPKGLHVLGKCTATVLHLQPI